MQKEKFRVFLLLVCVSTLAGCETYPRDAENNAYDVGNGDNSVAINPVGLQQAAGNCPQNPEQEIRDGIDNDCDGAVDENTEPVPECMAGSTTACVNECGNPGVNSCVNGFWQGCNAQNCQQSACQEPAGVLYERVNGCYVEQWECVHHEWVLRYVNDEHCGGDENPPACQPSREICDEFDNDCDGRIDENLTEQCTNECGNIGINSCVNGFWQGCNAQNCNQPPACRPSREICDNADNDCNGRVDENLTRACQPICGVGGQQECQNGSWTLCEPTDIANEICDGFDNNCNSRIDENLTRPCRNDCGNGTEICSEGEWINCSARLPTLEECDNVDNDCDSRTDEDLRRRRDNECGIGYETCNRGTWGGFDGRTAQPEICDNQDNDCNGRVDDSLIADCFDLYGNLGTQQCNAGVWSICRADIICHLADEEPAQDPPQENPPANDPPPQNPPANPDDEAIMDPPPQQDPPAQDPPPQNPPACQPSQEICDNADNNCNGRVDEDLIRDCWNECGNGGVETCTAGVWGQCDAPVCGGPSPAQDPPPQDPPAGGGQNPPAENPPPPAPPEIPIQTAPGEFVMIEVPIGQQGAVNLTWQACARAVQYEYLIRWGGFNESGSIIEQRVIAQTSVNFTRQQRFFGNQMLWKVRALDASGQTSGWSPAKSFFFSYPAGAVLRCSSADCPSPNTWYVVSRDRFDWGVVGVPQQIIVYYVSANCINGRHATDVSFQNMANYYRAVYQNGCPTP